MSCQSFFRGDLHMPSFGQRLKELREHKNVSQKELSEHIQVSTRQLRRYENDDFEPNLSTLKALADYFGVSLDYLVGRDRL